MRMTASRGANSVTLTVWLTTRRDLKSVCERSLLRETRRQPNDGEHYDVSADYTKPALRLAEQAEQAGRHGKRRRCLLQRLDTREVGHTTN